MRGFLLNLEGMKNYHKKVVEDYEFYGEIDAENDLLTSKRFLATMDAIDALKQHERSLWLLYMACDFSNKKTLEHLELIDTGYGKKYKKSLATLRVLLTGIRKKIKKELNII